MIRHTPAVRLLERRDHFCNSLARGVSGCNGRAENAISAREDRGSDYLRLVVDLDPKPRLDTPLRVDMSPLVLM